MTDPERVREATRSYIEADSDRHELLEALLDHQEHSGSWGFGDAPVDSGQFGELVSRPFVEDTDDGEYRFRDQNAVAAVVRNDSSESTTDSQTSSSRSVTSPDLTSLRAIDSRLVGAVFAVFAVFVAARSLFYSSVFRDGHVVSPANDPYFYRYWQAELLEHSNGTMDFGMLATVGEQTRIRPLSHFLNWWTAELTGAPDLVAAFQPIVASVLLAVTVYALAHTLTRDHRVALGAVLLLALTPVLAVYTGLGFLEHRPYQYLWVGVMAASLGWLAMDVTRLNQAGVTDPGRVHCRKPRAWLAAGILAIGIGAMAHTWGGSPLSYLPVATYLALRVVADHREGINPLFANGPTVAGIAVGSLGALAAHLRWGWHESIAATVPVTVAAGAVGVVLLATLWTAIDFSARSLLATEAVLGVVGVVLFWQLRPEDVDRLIDRADDLFGRETATETASLLTIEQGVIFGPLYQVGIGFYLALVPLVVITYYVTRAYNPAWLAAVCFTWFYFVLAAIQVRFAAQFSIFCAVFGAVGLVYLLNAVDLARPLALFERTGPDGPPVRLPQSRTVGVYLGVFIIGVLLINLIFVPSLLSQVQHSDEQFEATLLIDDHAETVDREYPANFVLSQWGDSRMHNYFVSGEAQGYGFAQSNYLPFISDTVDGPDEYYDEFSDRVGYLVLTDIDSPPESVHRQLFDDFAADGDGPAHYQLLYAEGDVRAYALVEGATIEYNTSANATVTATTAVEAGGEEFTYQRTTTATEEGTATVRVAYPGTYQLGAETVTVTEDDVFEGNTTQ